MLGGFLTGMSNVQLENATGFAGLTAEEAAFFENCEGIECKDDVEFAVPRMMMENNENFYNLAMAITNAEIQHYVATNEEVIYEEGRLASIWNSVKAAVKKAWEKVKGFFKKVFDTIAGWLKTDKKFVEKYEKVIRDFKGSVEVSAFTYTHLFDDVEDLSGAEDDITDVEKAADATDEWVEKSVNTIRGKAIGYSGPLKAEEFGAELKKFFRNGKSEKESRTFTSAQADELIAEVKDCKDAKKAAHASYKACEKYFKCLMAEIKKGEAWSYKEADKDGKVNGESKKDVAKAVGRFTKICNKCITISHTIMMAHVAALNAAHADAKSIILKIAAEANKKKDDKKPEATGESGMLEGFSLI